MCMPVAAALTAAAAVVSSAGQLQAGAYASRVARNQAIVAQRNKQLVRENAQDTIVQGQEQQRQLGREAAARIGAQTARMGANNTDVTFGSAARTIEDTKMIAREDMQALNENIRQRVKGLQIDAWKFENDSRTARAEASQAKTAAKFGVASTLLGSATQYANFRMRQNTGH